MGQQKLWKGVWIGALIGGALVLIDKDTRQYVSVRSREAGTKYKGYVTNPSDAIHTVRVNYEQFSKRVSKGLEDLIEILNKAEDILNRVGEINQEVEQQLKAVDDPKEAS